MPTPLPASLRDFQRQFAARVASSPGAPYPDFPPLFEALKRRLPDIADELEAVEKSIAEWVKSVQTRQ